MGGTGNDTLNGTVMTDLYLFNLGDGADTVIEADLAGYNTGAVDVLRFGPGINPIDISVSRNGSDLVFKHTYATDKVTVKNWYTSQVSTANQIERIEFEDAPNTVWLASELTAQGLCVTGTSAGDTLAGLASFANALFGGGGDDTLTGGGAIDILVGGNGTDTLTGGGGDDIYRWATGDGFDTVSDISGTDQLELTGIDLSLIHYWRQGNDLLIETNGPTEAILVKSQFLGTGANKLEGFYINGAFTSANDMALMAVPKT